MTTRQCAICGNDIHPARLEVAPRTVTCCTECSLRRQHQLRAAATKRWREKQKAAKQAAKEGK